MERTEYDDVSDALCKALGFYNKRLDGPSERIWHSALRGHDAQCIKRALTEYTRRGRYAPKPVDILEILNKRQSEATAAETNKPYVPCPEHIRKATLWFLKRITSDSVLLKGLFEDSPDVDQPTQEKYLLIVNQQAKLYNRPESIPDEFKLAEVWK